MTRSCRRYNCGRAAASTLTFRYDTAQAWLEDLASEPEPQRWDLCRDHAGVLTVPVGWRLVDARSAPEQARESVVAGRRRNRYAELSARLPALAAEVAASSRLVGTGSLAGESHGDAVGGASPRSTSD